ncbi:MAG: outer membrane protein assembly factor BamD [Candidatus Cloacimonetes bacterium]|nr:outer membrane protein assembly factor BamD [Candidatus Cloacimonadota bacterium]MBL7085504.1 outer membrane protein assembly factor BamD [Candidatus Cloacimonadota bacterium]
MKKLLILILLLIISCAHKLTIDGMSAQQKIKIADKLYSKKNFHKAQETYEIITFESKGDTLIEKAQYQLANCYYNLKLYEDAIFEYEELLRLFPFSQYSENADFNIGVCWYKLSLPSYYEQEETYNAIEQFKLFLDKYPNSEKIQDVENILAKCTNKFLTKKYNNAYIYYKMGYYNASVMYLNEIFDENIIGEIDKKALILAAKIYHKKDDKSALEKVYQTFKQKYPDNLEIEKVRQFLEK